MKRFFTLLLGALAMVAVALISAFIAMRLAIHGREATVPTLTGLAVSDASQTAARQGLRLTLEDRFYSSDIPAGRVLAQDPAPGTRVRRDWNVRITESLGPQHVNIPDLTGESERAATVTIRRLSLDLGVVAHLTVPGEPDVVLAQTPPVNSASVSGPRVSLLVSDPPSAADAPAYVMPSLAGLSYAAAAERAAAAGLHLEAVTAPPPAAAPAPNGSPNAPTPAPAANPPAANSPPILPANPAAGIVIAQIPQPGRRVAQGDQVRVILNQPGATAAQPPAQ